MKSKLKKSLSLLLALVMVLSCMSMSAFADGNVAKIGETEYATLKAAIEAVPSGSSVEIVLLADYSGTDWIDYVTFANKTITLDLNGHNYTRTSGAAIQVGKNGTITIKDSVGTGSIASADNIGIETKAPTAIVNVQGGTVRGETHGIKTDNATVNVSGGAVTGAKAGVYTSRGTINISGGIVTGAEQGILDYNNDKPSTICVTGGTITCTGTASDTAAIMLSDNGSTLTVSGESSISGGNAAIAVFREGIVTINGGAISSDGFGIAGNGSEGYEGTQININGGSVTSNTSAAIYHPQGGSLTITGGDITGAGYGVFLRGGTLAMSGGSVTATDKAAHKVGDYNSELAPAAVVYDHEADYPGNITVNAVSITGGTFSDFSALDYLGENADVTIKLLNDVTLSSKLEIEAPGKSVTLDLNHHTLAGRTNLKAGTLTIKNGTVAGGALQALNVYGSDTSATNYSVLNIESNVTVTADVYAISMFGKTAGGNGYGAVINMAGTVSTTGDTKNGAIFVSGNLGKNVPGDANNVINITGTVTSTTDAALALNGLATVNVKNGATITGNTAIAVKRGTLNVEDGATVHATGAQNYPGIVYNNGTEMTGAAVSVTETYSQYGPLAVNITGGTFTSDNADAVYKRTGTYQADAIISITGGTFSSEPNASYIADDYVATKDNGTWTVGAAVTLAPIKYFNTWKADSIYYIDEPAAGATTQATTPKIKREGESSYQVAGENVTISWSVTEKDATSADGAKASIATVDQNGLVTFSEPGTVKVWLTMTDAAGTMSANKTVSYKLAPAYVVSTDGQTKTAYATLLSAFNAAQDGDTIYLNSDYSTNNIGKMTLNADKKITLDLNGSTASLTANYRVDAFGALFTVKKGTLTVTDSKATGGIVASGTNARAFNVDGTANTAATEAVLTIGEGVSVSSAADCCVTIFGKATLNTAGDLSSPANFAIAGNGTANNAGTVINITGGTITGDEVAVYHPQNGTLNISDGTITGDTAIYQKSGTLNITGGTITGNGAAAEYTYNGSGANATGDALVIDNCGYPGGVPTATISGGTFTSTNANAVGSYYYAEKANAAITGFITGGTFSSDVSAYVANGYAATENSQTGWTVSAEKIAVIDDPDEGILVTVGDNSIPVNVDASVQKENAAGTSAAQPASATDVIKKDALRSAITELLSKTPALEDDATQSFAVQMSKKEVGTTTATKATYEVHPELILTTTHGTESSTVSTKLENSALADGAVFQVTLDVPSGVIGTYAKVTHRGTPPEVLYPEINNGKVTISLDNFSEVDVESDDRNLITVNQTAYLHNFVDRTYLNLQDSTYLNIVLYVNHNIPGGEMISANNGKVVVSFGSMTKELSLATDFSTDTSDATAQAALAQNGYYAMMQQEYYNGTLMDGYYTIRLKVYPNQMGYAATLKLYDGNSEATLYQNVGDVTTEGTSVDWNNITIQTIENNQFSQTVYEYLTKLKAVDGWTDLANTLIAYGKAAAAKFN